MFRRFCTRSLLLAALVTIIPACGKNKVTAPNVLAVSPAFTATNVPHWPLIVLQFDMDMNPSTITPANIRIINNANLTPFGGGWAVTYRPVARQALITPGAFLTENITWDITCTPNVKNTDGTAINGSQAGEVIENQFTTRTTTSAAVQIFPNFAQPTAATKVGSSGVVTLTWNRATESALVMNGVYDVYFSSGAVDLLNTNASNFLSVASGVADPMNVDISGLAAGVNYNFIVVARDNNGNVFVTAEISAVAGP